MIAHRSIFARAVRALIPLTLLLAGCALQPTAYAPGSAPWDATVQAPDWKDIAGIQYVQARHDLPWAETPQVPDWKDIAGIQYTPPRHDLPWAETPPVPDWKDIAGIQYTPVDSSATVSTPHASSQSAIAFRSSVTAPNSRTGSPVACRGTATQWLDAPTSIPAALGNTITSSSRVRIAIVHSRKLNERQRHGRRRNSTRSHKRDTHLCVRHCRRRCPDQAD